MKSKKSNLDITNIDQLSDFLGRSKIERKKIEAVIESHPLKISSHYASLIDWNDPSDPLLRMILPNIQELDSSGLEDTSGEFANTKINGLQHKYPQTALILTTYQCFGYCRFCFRKRMTGKIDTEIAYDYPKILDYIKKHKEINNVLLSGGDTFILQTAKLLKIITDIYQIPHIKNVRIGTRVLAYYPQRIINNKKLADGLKKINKQGKRIYIITHFNHAREISKESLVAANILQSAGLILLNQAVLLKGVNDDAAILAELFNKLSEVGIRPYYLFQCRPVKNELHFQVEIEKGIKLSDEAKKYCSGLAKTFKYICSHKSGKVEIVGKRKDKTLFKYHQAKNIGDVGKIMAFDSNPKAKWFDDYLK